MVCQPTPSECAQKGEGGCESEYRFDTSKEQALLAAKTFCENIALDHDGEAAPIGELFSWVKGTELVDNYAVANEVWAIGIEDDKGCTTGAPERYPYRPTIDFDFFSILYGSWRQCNNMGRGGIVEAGCLRYTMVPAKPTAWDLERWDDFDNLDITSANYGHER